MKKYTHNNAGTAIVNESRIFVDDGFGETAFPVPYACINGEIAVYPLRKDEDLNKKLIVELEKQGHLVAQKAEIIQYSSNTVRDSGEIVLDLSVPEAVTDTYLYAYIGVSAAQAEFISSYPMFEKQIGENAKLKIDGDFGADTLDQIADLAKHNPLELTTLAVDTENDDFIKEKLVYAGLQTDGDNMGDHTFRFTLNDQYTENTKHRVLKLGAGTTTGMVVLDGFRYLRVKVLKGVPVSLTLFYNNLK